MDSNDIGENIDLIAIQKGSRKEFEKVVELYYNELFFYAKSLCRDELLAKDLVQEAFFGLWQKRETLNAKTVLRGWLYLSLKNKFLDHVKKYRKETYFFERTYSETMETLSQQDHQENLSRKIELMDREIDLLPKKCQQVLVLSKKEGLTNAEISDYLNISIKTVEGHLSNAYKILKEKLYEKFQILFTVIGFRSK
ncbi:MULTISPECIES: RNA polymerase sigma factor [Flavobacteriaceae]|jgi:RNA polymerase sigma-70 factor (ECF subfamily)|uniref:Sigma-70 family RNA polymerase sigma factor n=3 Tax=Flagellimonas TaxID=444459 RepID=A0A3A1NIZ5_9FLAO|nr:MULTISPECIES: sigma-70 family RNA polymerase sigma factor [Allomuricauda]MAO15849.1 RNA polymerase sigma-70 factor [Allomuricauda sp.]UBZ14378.1 sigma-70 family RNA polymerase sigma factor [Allomuricauda aquimarina]MBO0356095.1 sigma-70 family RNA polymerase sigma factor [Allomuricauda aurea]RIV44797.1 sigma-70 family RNA polymerase sigma factor [Allomuricauda maritima]TXJ95104.1 sigma-70 family RNA polymerase sigma factor [Allomuricauda maritima]|tara:strand:+ start:83 stop:670 length:588 start_codon:yes stop_codon:yes gene_type:complete